MHLHRTVLLPVLIGVVRVAAVGAVGVISDVVEVGVVVMLLEAFGVIQVAATAAASGSYLKLALEFDVLPHAQAVVRLVAEVHGGVILRGWGICYCNGSLDGLCRLDFLHTSS